MIDFVIKFSVLIIVSVFLILPVKNYRSEYAFCILIAVSTVIITVVIEKLSPALNSLISIYKNVAESEKYFSLVIKVLVISYISDFCANTCRDSGFSSLASKAEFLGKCVIFILCVPLLSSILETAVGLIKI